MAEELAYVLIEKPTREEQNFITEENKEMTISIAESVTAGAVQNIFCREIGAMKFFKGGLTAYSLQSKKDILGINYIHEIDRTNYATARVAYDMAYSAIKLFNSRVGISTVGFSTKYHRERNTDKYQEELNVEFPYAYICMIDAYKKYHVIKKIIFKDFGAIQLTGYESCEFGQIPIYTCDATNVQMGEKREIAAEVKKAKIQAYMAKFAKETFDEYNTKV